METCKVCGSEEKCNKLDYCIEGCETAMNASPTLAKDE